MLRVVLEDLNNYDEISKELDNVGVNEGYISISPKEEVTVVRPLKLNYETFANEVEGNPSSYMLKEGVNVIYNDNFLPENLEYNPLATNFSRVRLKGNCVIIGKVSTIDNSFALLSKERIILLVKELVLCKKNVDSF